MKHYPALPHGPINQLFDDVWVIEGVAKMPMLLPMRFTRSMAVVREGGQLTLVNSMRLTDPGLEELQKLGEIANVIRLGGFHGRDDAFYKERFGAKIFALQGHRYCRKIDDSDQEYFTPDVRLAESDSLPISNASLKIMHSSTPPEGILRLGKEGGILIAADALQNMNSTNRFFNWPAKLLMTKMGFIVPHNIGPGWLKFAKPSRDEIKTILDLDFEHVLPCHGYPVIGQAKEKFRPVITNLS